MLYNQICQNICVCLLLLRAFIRLSHDLRVPGLLEAAAEKEPQVNSKKCPRVSYLANLFGLVLFPRRTRMVIFVIVSRKVAAPIAKDFEVISRAVLG